MPRDLDSSPIGSDGPLRLRIAAAFLRFSTALTLLAGCRADSRQDQSSGNDSLARGASAPPEAVVTGPEARYDLLLPTRWAGHYRIDSLSTGERGRALPGALLFLYLPADSSLRPEALMALAVYDSATWRAVRAEEGPPPGDSIAVHAGRIYVVGLPQSNPFAPNSPDAAVFQVLQLRPAELTGLIRFR